MALKAFFRRARLMGNVNSLLRDCSVYRGLSIAAASCPSCGENIGDLVNSAVLKHQEILRDNSIPFQMVLLRGSSLHIPLLKYMINHGHLSVNSCKFCKSQRSSAKDALELKKTPNDVDLITLGIPNDKTRVFSSLIKPIHDQRLDLTAHFTVSQLDDPNSTYTSFFNLENLKIPSNPSEVNPKKFARHFASMLFFLHAYPVVAGDQSIANSQNKELVKIRAKFVRHLRSLSDEQLEEVARILNWNLRKEAYVLFHLGGSKQERHDLIRRYNEGRSETLSQDAIETFFHLRLAHFFLPRHYRR